MMIKTMVIEKCGLSPRPFLVLGLLCHLLNSLLLFLLCRKYLQIYSSNISRNKSSSLVSSVDLSALMASSLFAIHPLRAEALGWLSSHPYLYSGVFLLLCLHTHLLYHTTSPTLVNESLAFFFFSLAVLSKSASLGLAPVLVLLRATLYRSSARRVKVLPTILPWAGSLVFLYGFHNKVLATGCIVAFKLGPMLDAPLFSDPVPSTQIEPSKRQTTTMYQSIWHLVDSLVESLAYHELYSCTSFFVAYRTISANTPLITNNLIDPRTPIPFVLPWPQRLFKASYSIIWYITQSIYPQSLSSMYPLFHSFNLSEPKVLIPTITIVLTFGILLYWMIRRVDHTCYWSPPAQFFLLWFCFIFMCLPTLGFFSHGWPVWVADRYRYVHYICYI